MGGLVRQGLIRLLRVTAMRESVGRVLLLTAILCAGCADNPISTSSTSTTGIAASISLTSAIVSVGQPPTASIVATVRDGSSLAVGGVTVDFSTTSGFITTGARTGADGVAIAILTGTAAGTSPTVTASVAADTQTITATTVVRF